MYVLYIHTYIHTYIHISAEEEGEGACGWKGICNSVRFTSMYVCVYILYKQYRVLCVSLMVAGLV